MPRSIITFFICCIWPLLTGCPAPPIERTNESNNDATDRYVGGRCEGCEAALEFGELELTDTDTLPGAGVDAPLLILTGTVYRKDGRTPAEDIIVYIHHTDQEGLYQVRRTLGMIDPDLDARNSGRWARRHGSLRGWVRTGPAGTYTFHTQRPAPYPDRKDPAHIHMFIKEPELVAYYVEDILFADDTLLTTDHLDGSEERGGSGIVQPVWKEDHWVIERDVILGRNIPEY